MKDNIYFDMQDLMHIGKEVIIGKTVRIRFQKLKGIEYGK